MAMDGQLSLGSCSNLEALRQRAQKAAEHYRQQEQQSSDVEKGDNRKSASTHLSGRNYQIMPQFSELYKSSHGLESQHTSESGQNILTGKAGISSNVNKFLSNASSNPTLTSTSGNNFSHAKMRAGILDLRSSYNACHSGGSGHVRSRTFHGPHTSSRASTQTHDLEGLSPMAAAQLQQKSTNLHRHQPEQFKESSTFTSNKTVFSRSTNNMEMDNAEVNSTPLSPINLHREYGSTSSLDKLGTGSENFFSILSEFKQSYSHDQRSPAPPGLQELLQGRLGSSSEPQIQTAVEASRSVRFMSELPDSDKTSGEIYDHQSKLKKSKSKNKERTQRARSITGEIGVILLKGKSKPKEGKQRAKSITGDSGGLLKKLRGKIDSDLSKSEHTGVVGEDSPARYKGDSRRRSFSHFDCQSVGIDLGKVVQQRYHGRSSKNNILTSASGYSDQRTGVASDKDSPDLLVDIDEGDGKSNDLVLSCPFYRNELGGEDERSVSLAKVMNQKLAAGPCTSAVSSADYRSQVRHPACCGIAILDSSPSPSGQILPPLVSHHGHVIEYVDHGAYYYRHFFYTQDHQNFFGMDENLGPIAISVRREKSDPAEKASSQSDCGNVQYRIICRTRELRTLRGCVLEEAIPTRMSSTRAIPIKDVLEVAVPGVQLSCLRQAVVGQRTCEQLLKLDEQGISNTYKVGIMYCKSGQGTEEEMYNNENSGPALDEFLSLISQKVRLKGFDQYRAGLDCKTDTTGTHSYYTTFKNNEIMFHVSTMLPYTASNKQQLLRKRHIGNDIVTIVFQEPGALAFSPATVVSQFQHVFIVVRVSNPMSESARYSVSVARSKDVPPFGPKITENCSFKKSQDFVDFVLAKVINAENAAHKSDKFLMMATRTREEYLKDLAANYVTNTSIDSGSKLSKFGLGSGRKKDKSRKRVIPDTFVKGALVWEVQVEDMGNGSQIECLLAIASDTIVLVEKSVRDVIFTIPCSSVIGWTLQPSSLRLHFGAGECVVFRPISQVADETLEIITRLQTFTNGAETFKLTLKRNGMGQLGFHIQPDGIVTDVEPYGYAWEAGLRKGSRLVEICKVATITLSHDQILDLLRTSATVKVVVVFPTEDGSPRGNNSLNTMPRFSASAGKITPPSELSSIPLHQLQPLQSSPDHTLSPRWPTGASWDFPDHSSGQLYNDGRASYFGYSGQELADMYRSLRATQESLVSSGDEHYSRSKAVESCNPVTSEVNTRSQSSQYNQRLHRVDRVIGSPDGSMDNSGFGSASQGTSAARQFASMEYTSGTLANGQISLDLLKQIQNKKYLVSKSQGSSPQDTLKSSYGSGNSPRVATNFGNAFEVSVNRASQNIKRNDLNVLNKEESTQTNMGNEGRTIKPVMTKGCSEPQPVSPRPNQRNLSGLSLDERALSRSGTSQQKAGKTTKDFHTELLRLIDLNLSESDLVGYSTRGEQSQHNSGQLQVTLSDNSLHSSKKLISDRTPAQVNGFSQRASARAKFDLGSTRQRKADSSPQPQQLSVRKQSDSCDYHQEEEGWYSLDEPSSPRPHSSQQMGTGLPSPPSSTATSSVTVTNTSELRIQDLEKRIGRMSQDLDQTQQTKTTMVSEMQHLQADNVRLQEESQTAASQLRQFSEWFFNTIYQK